MRTLPAFLFGLVLLAVPAVAEAQIVNKPSAWIIVVLGLFLVVFSYAGAVCAALNGEAEHG